VKAKKANHGSHESHGSRQGRERRETTAPEEDRQIIHAEIGSDGAAAMLAGNDMVDLEGDV
jgi:hypothetical protein